MVPADSSSVISFENRDCTLSGPFALKGSRFSRLISILISDIFGERGGVSLGILKSSLLKAL